MVAIPDDAPDVETLAQARARLNERVETREGARCPCCDQFAKVYRRRLSSGIARALIRGHRAAGMGWFHAPTVVGDRGDLSKARYWGLVEEERTRRPGGGRAGFWRLTVQGDRFVRGQLWVPAHARIYTGRFLGLDNTEKIDIHGALGSRYSLAGLMAEPAPGTSPLAGAG
ncbi:MAG: hypothetical protein ACREQ5_00815 [Candidatus Dormibacteria bacterium]